MPNHVVLVSDPLSAQAIANLKASPHLTAQEVKGLSEDALIPLVGEIDAWIVRGATKVTRRLIEAAPRLRWVARAGVGVDNIDVAAAKERGIGVLNVPGANAVAPLFIRVDGPLDPCAEPLAGDAIGGQEALLLARELLVEGGA